MASERYNMDSGDNVELTEEKKKSSKANMIFGIVLCILFAAGVTVGLVLWYTKDKPAKIPEPTPRPKLYRTFPSVRCRHEPDVTEEQCVQKGCVWKELDEAGAPSCFFGPGYGYLLSEEPLETPMGYSFTLRRIDKPSLYGGDIHTVKLQVEFVGKNSLRIKFGDKDKARFEIPDEALTISGPSEAVPDADRMYNVTWSNETEFGFAVFRRDNGAVVFDTRVPGMVMSDQFLQMTTKLPSSHVYGFGEHNHRRLQHDMEWKRWGIFTRDLVPVEEWNLYGAQPFYLNLEKDGKANGVFLKNSNAMDVTLQPDPHPAISYRVIGGVLDFYVFLGESPENVVQLYTKDVQFGGIDYMFEKVHFTYDRASYAGLPEFVDELHANGQRYIVILDHAMAANDTVLEAAQNNSLGFDAYQDGLNRGVFIKAPNSTDLLFTESWPGLAVVPDFTDSETQLWWTKWCRFLRENETVEYDALTVGMNEPSSFVNGSVDGCRENSWNYPPYVPKIQGDGMMLFEKTICMDSEQAMGFHYNVHSLYGHTMAMQTYRTLKDIFPGKRPFAMTRSNFAGTQKYAIHWLGDNRSHWSNMHWSIVAMLEYSIFGFSMTGSDICGFWFDTEEELCTRWTQLGAFYPYSRNHNADGFRPQDPASFSDDMVRASRRVLNTRYKFLPFLYTLLYHAHTDGATVARPLFFQFPNDNTTWAIDRQFMWGSALLISPVLEKGMTTVEAYFPPSRWYDYYTGVEVDGAGRHHILDAPLDKINLHVRGGSVIPWQQPANTTVYSRTKPMGLIVALDESQEATGSLFWDDGESVDSIPGKQSLLLEFTVASDRFKIRVVQGTFAGANELSFETIEIYGLGHRPGKVTVDDTAVNSMHIKSVAGGTGIQITNQKMNITVDHELVWDLF